ncbi:MAG: putative Ig domain-containing protein [Acidobacteria bacterium]|nr:putative Ig domain-containing protein [Acidobacteriota bacterium]
MNISCGTVTINPATLPGGVIGTAYSQTVSTTPAGAYSYSVSSGALPIGLMLNAATGAITGTPTASGTFNFRLTVTADNCSGARDYTVIIACANVTITTTTLPASTVGNAYSQIIGVNPAAPAGSYTFALLMDNLPSGLTLNATTGLLSGLPSVTGSYNFTIKATAANGCTATQSYTLQLNCPSVTLSALSTPVLNSTYNQSVRASPAGGNYSFAVTAGALPAGLSLNAARGVVSGTPTSAGAYNFTITATGFGACTGSRAYTGTIAGSTCPTITTPGLPGGQPGQLYSNSVAATPAGTYSYAVTAGSLPPGLTLYASAGLLFGYPATAGTYNFTITATDGNNCTGTRVYSLTVSTGALAARTALAQIADYDGDGKSDPALWSAKDGMWRIFESRNQQAVTRAWGMAGDVTLLGDYDGDGKTDLAVFRRATGTWLVKLSSGHSGDGQYLIKQWGLGTDVPVLNDYDGDGKTDCAVWRGATGTWYVWQSATNTYRTQAWGAGYDPTQ